MESICNRVLNLLEPNNVYEQAQFPVKERTLRMRVSDAFFQVFKRWL